MHVRRAPKTSLFCLSFTTLSVFELSMIGTLVPFIVRDLKLTYKSMGLILSLGLVPPLLLIPFSGNIMAGVKPSVLFESVIISLAVSNLSVYLVPTASVIALTRIIAGSFMLFSWPLCSLAVSVGVDESRRGSATSIYDSGSLIGLALTYLALLPFNDWRQPLLLSSVAGFVYAALSYPIARTVLHRQALLLQSPARPPPHTQGTRLSVEASWRLCSPHSFYR